MKCQCELCLLSQIKDQAITEALAANLARNIKLLQRSIEYSKDTGGPYPS